MKTLLVILLLAAAELQGSCEIAQRPAATLLLPYFEVDLGDARGETTLLTLTNISDREQLAHVTLWTDRAYPVLTFDVRLTGYDVQGISLRDVVAEGRIANSGCEAAPRQLEPAAVSRLQDALTTGRLDATCAHAGEVHPGRAIGYATIDVVQSCTTLSPYDPGYYDGVIAHENVLTGDYQQVDLARGYAEGGPLVHIRAVDGSIPKTFYARYQQGADADRRQPLPAAFAMQFDTRRGAEVSFKVWREPPGYSRQRCQDHSDQMIPMTEYVTVDEEENAEGVAESGEHFPRIHTPAVSRIPLKDSDIPEPFEQAEGGWVYMNLNADRRDFETQSWVIASTRRPGSSRDIAATPLATGCSMAPDETAVTRGVSRIAPLPPSPFDSSCELAVRPAATLLLPRFEVDLAARRRTTRFTITNVADVAYAARVTLWSARAEAVLTFNIYLTGYDVQTLDLYDVLALGTIAPPTGTGFEQRGSPTGNYSSDENVLIDEESCRQNLREVPRGAIAHLRRALGAQTATGYVTIDVVRNCGTWSPEDAGYYRNDLLFENVLIGDYENEQGEGGSLVHILADRQASYASTFYGRYAADGRDARQPLPSRFAARWLDGAAFDTDLTIWRNARGLVETVRFDEDENATASFSVQPGDPLVQANVDEELFPPNVTNAPGGWMHVETTSQAWVTSSMSAGTLAVDGGVIALGDSCTP